MRPRCRSQPPSARSWRTVQVPRARRYHTNFRRNRRTSPFGSVQVIEDNVVQRVLAVALRTGGDFAEVFAEDKRLSSGHLDDGRVEELTSRSEEHTSELQSPDHLVC